jgi:hypothetical protein
LLPLSKLLLRGMARAKQQQKTIILTATSERRGDSDTEIVVPYTRLLGKLGCATLIYPV